MLFYFFFLFQAGKVSWYDTESNRIMLNPVPEYPLPVKKEMDEDSALHLDSTPYGENGSLKVLVPSTVFGLPSPKSFFLSDLSHSEVILCIYIYQLPDYSLCSPVFFVSNIIVIYRNY